MFFYDLTLHMLIRRLIRSSVGNCTASTSTFLMDQKESETSPRFEQSTVTVDAK